MPDNNPPQISTQSQFDALPAGTGYYAPDGSYAVKGGGQVLTNQTPTYQPNIALDAAKSTASGMVQGAEGLIGFPGDVQRGAEALVGNFFPKEYQEAKKFNLPDLPTGEDVQQWTNQNLPPVAAVGNYQPQTVGGETAKTVGNFIPGALIPLGDVGTGARLLTRAMIPGVASEGASKLGQYYLGDKPGDLGDTAIRTGAAILSGAGGPPPGPIPKIVSKLAGRDITIGEGIAMLANPELGTKLLPVALGIGAVKGFETALKNKQVQAFASKLYGKPGAGTNSLVAAMLASGGSAPARVPGVPDDQNQ